MWIASIVVELCKVTPGSQNKNEDLLIRESSPNPNASPKVKTVKYVLQRIKYKLKWTI